MKIWLDPSGRYSKEKGERIKRLKCPFLVVGSFTERKMSRYYELMWVKEVWFFITYFRRKKWGARNQIEKKTEHLSESFQFPSFQST